MKWLRDRFKYAFSGLRYALFDKSIAFQFLLAFFAILAGIVLRCSKVEWLWILLSIVLVVSFEVMNSCVENIVDYISLQRDPRAKKIKDMAAGAVFLISVFALIVALVILLPKVLYLFS